MSILFSPLVIKSMRLENRIVFPGMSTRFASPDGHVTERMIRYYEERALGGAGMIIVEAARVADSGTSFANGLSVAHDHDVPGLRQLAQRVRRHGARIAVQLQHGGRCALADKAGAVPLVSGVPGLTPYDGSFVLRPADIAELIRAWGLAAARAREAGFDAVEIHGAHGYLPAQFFSPLLNRRDDEYGGSLENRMRFSLELVREVRRVVGGDFPIFYRLSAEEGMAGGITLDDSRKLAVRLAREGADVLNVSVGTRETRHMVAPPPCVPEGWNAPLARSLKEAVGDAARVAVAGRIVNERVAEALLERGDADLAVMGRALIADPHLPRLARAGKGGDILRCVGCNEGCSGGAARGTGIGCALNPLAGAEGRYDLGPASTPRRVLVIGGGPAGMAAALAACRRGHHVILCEKDEHLGGLLEIARRPPYKEPLGLIRPWYEAMLARCAAGEEAGSLEVRLSSPVGLDEVLALAPDVTFVATGGRPVVPGFCASVPYARPARNLLDGSVPVPERVLVLGGGLIGCETAEFMADRGARVTVVEMQPVAAKDMEPRTRTYMMRRLTEKKVRILTDTTLLELGDDHRVKVRHALWGECTLEPVDLAVLALGYRPESALYAELSRNGLNCRAIGDCAGVGKIMDAVRQGFEAALTV